MNRSHNPVVMVWTLVAATLLHLLSEQSKAAAAQPAVTNYIYVVTNQVFVPNSIKIVNTNLVSIPTNGTVFVLDTNALAGTKPPEKYPKEGINWPRVRYDWTDVLVSEDPSQPGNNKLPASYADIKGATFSYASNRKNNSDTWSANGALILPVVHYFDLRFNRLTMIAVAPSVSINKVSDSAQPTNDIDHLDYRLGAYLKYLGARVGDFEYAAQVRAAFVYGTDTGHRASLPAGELEIEPQLLWYSEKSGTLFPDWVSIGYQSILYGNRDNKKSDDVIDYKMRAWLHMEGGDLQQNGALWNTVNGSFFRLGPTVQGQLTFNNILNGLSVSGQYGYQTDISGPTGRNSVYSLSGALNLYKDDARHQKMALTVSYTKGGLTLSKQPVDTLNVGLGVIF